jgi:hypothetical protein
MKHDPLRDGDNAVLRLTERSQLGLYCIVGVGHYACRISLHDIQLQINSLKV